MVQQVSGFVEQGFLVRHGFHLADVDLDDSGDLARGTGAGHRTEGLCAPYREASTQRFLALSVESEYIRRSVNSAISSTGGARGTVVFVSRSARYRPQERAMPDVSNPGVASPPPDRSWLPPPGWTDEVPTRSRGLGGA